MFAGCHTCTADDPSSTSVCPITQFTQGFLCIQQLLPLCLHTPGAMKTSSLSLPDFFWGGGFDLVTTSRPTDGVDVYFEKPVDDTEHANFLRAKTDLEERRMLRINKVTFKESLCRWHLKHLGHQSGGRAPRLASSDTPSVHGAQSTCKKRPLNCFCRNQSVFHNGSISVPQIMKEWAEADNKSKTLPKVERQAMNEVTTQCFLRIFFFLNKTSAVAQPAHVSSASISSLCCRRWRSRWPVRGRGWWRRTWSGWRPSSTTTAAWPWRTT